MRLGQDIREKSASHYPVDLSGNKISSVALDMVLVGITLMEKLIPWPPVKGPLFVDTITQYFTTLTDSEAKKIIRSCLEKGGLTLH